MPLAIVHNKTRGRSEPKAICDHCNEIITDLRKAYVLWDSKDEATQSPVTGLKMVHGDIPECDRLTKGKPHMELALFWRWLGNGGGINSREKDLDLLQRAADLANL